MQLYLEVINDLRKENMRDIRTLIDGLDKEIWGVRERMNSIEDKYLDKEINHEDYNRMISRQKDKLKSLQDRKELLETPNRGRIEPQLRYSMTLIDNIDKFFEYAPADNKIRLLSSIFPEKIEYDGKIFRTENLNSVLSLVYLQTNELRGLKKENEESFSTFPASVPRAGVEPAQG